MNKRKLKQEALLLIAKYFGQYTKELYRKFYEDKSSEEVFASLEQILLEVLGPKKANEIMAPLAKKYNLTIRDD